MSVPGVYGGFVDKLPMGAVVNKALTIKSGQTTCTGICVRCSHASRMVRSIRRSSSPTGCGSRTRPGLRDVQVQARQLHQGGAETT